MTTTQAGEATPELCAECSSPLVDNQRYCLQCGARRGKPRIDFTAFWKPMSPTGGRREQSEDQRDAQGITVAGGGPWFSARLSRQLAGALAGGMLAVGIVAGAAIGPGPASSPADSSTLAQRAIAALVMHASSGSQPSPQTSSTGASNEGEPAATNAVSHKAKASSKAASSETSTPVSSEGPSSSGSSTGTPSSEGSSSEGSSSKGSGEGEEAAPGTPVKLPPIKHVWLIALSGESLTNALAQPRTDPYLAKQLASKGTLLSGYALSASSALANGVALLSGQGVNLDTEQNCPSYTELQPPTVSANGLAEGVGCVYPHTVRTLADELTAAGLTWKAYVQGMESDQSSASASGTPGAATSPTPSAGAPPQPAAASVSCRHPEPGAADPNHAPTPGDPYLTFRNPFVYFHSLLDAGACASDDVDLSRLQGDLATPANTPNLSWIAPSACNDGSSTPCAPGTPAGSGTANGFLKEVVPQILATAAYRKEGLIAIVPDSAPTSSASAAAKPVGALLISPFVHSAAHVSERLNDFSLLKSLARLFGVLPLGHANDPNAVSFGATVYGTNGKAAKKAAQAASAAQPRRRAVSHAGG
jgi:phosphatidylinositol-3-phosphatase